jgi:ribosomal protein S18 acetylase RimI-like enzyme
MESRKPVRIETASEKDAREILALQKLAYLSEARVYNDDTIPPLTQSLDQIQAEFDRLVFLKAMRNEAIVGSVRAHMKDGTCFIGRLIVHPDLQRQGIGSRLMHQIEGCFPEARRFELFTGARSTGNLIFYRQLGYRICRQATPEAGPPLVFFEKIKPL